MANVLIIDDDSDTVGVSKDLLEAAGHRVQAAFNGEQGLKSLRSEKLPDCVLLDVDMPVMNGPGVAQQMLLHDGGEEKGPIILVSGRVDLPEVARRVGTPYFLAKACADYGDNLLALLNRALHERLAPEPALPGRERPLSSTRP